MKKQHFLTFYETDEIILSYLLWKYQEKDNFSIKNYLFISDIEGKSNGESFFLQFGHHLFAYSHFSLVRDIIRVLKQLFFISIKTAC